MLENNPVTDNARMDAIKHPPGLSPERPQIKRRTRAYNSYQIREALMLAKKVGVAAAAKACGVSIWAIYKAGAQPQNKDARRPKDPRPLPPMDLMVAAAKTALYWSSNMPGSRERIRMKRDCFDRAALKYRINPIVLWEQYTLNGIEGVPYSEK